VVCEAANAPSPDSFPAKATVGAKSNATTVTEAQEILKIAIKISTFTRLIGLIYVLKPISETLPFELVD
jgi:hypothetical protein